ncbi:tyrosine-type recombinase/integrase [Desulfopila aestuarii]|uniref:Core-binding (CB) domain-containing protein n=1 Tax=Desulfopila aestuarii DSM 18488 TaxID=1121416 RepID=A0A1M7Y167_9BACT|nr:hypothetical protein [Desulfopila aestuarii]SHO45318.1 hypothetical protein SAMN02745220_01038 [Desulfopila aestuarii DSM 18488]
MKGRIYTTQKCFVCQGALNYVEGRGHLSCVTHPDHQWKGACVVRFGRNHTKRFKSVLEAERHLIYLRVQTDLGKFDPREWAKDQPLSFLALRLKFIEYKKSTNITLKQVKDIERVLIRAGQTWDRMQIRDIAEAEIEDFLFQDHGVSSKTIANWKTALHNFFAWVVRREKKKSNLQMPSFPVTSFKMKMKAVVSIEDQQKIITEVKKISWNHNPRIWLAIKLLALYPRVRPGELINVKEGHINLVDLYIVFPQPKEREPKYIHLLKEVAEEIRESQRLYPAMPTMYFFRHLKRRNGLKVGTQFGPVYLNKWWKQACVNLGFSDVTLYPGTKHSTVTALGKIMSPEQIQHNVTGHASEAFKRYFLPDYQEKILATKQISDMQKKIASDNVFKITVKKNK